MNPAETQPCKAREILKARLRADLKVYADAIAAMQRSIGKDFDKAHQRAERVRLTYELAHKKLNEHLASHGCAKLEADGTS